MTDADNNISRIFTLGRLSIEEANNSRLEAVYPPGYHHYFYICLMPLDNTGHLVELPADDITGMAGTALNIIKYYDDPGSSEGVSGETDPFFTACYSFGTGDDNLFQYVGHFTRNNLLYIKVRTNTVPSTARYYEGFTLAVSFENTNGRWACNHNSGSGFDSSISFYQPPLPAPTPIPGSDIIFTVYDEKNYAGTQYPFTNDSLSKTKVASIRINTSNPAYSQYTTHDSLQLSGYDDTGNTLVTSVSLNYIVDFPDGGMSDVVATVNEMTGIPCSYYLVYSFTME